MAPYTYYLIWYTPDIRYYGVRYAESCDSSDLWVKYRTSSKEVRRAITMFGDPDVIAVDKSFDSKQKAIEYECSILTWLEVINSSVWLNNTNNKAIAYHKGLEGSLKAASMRKGTRLSLEHKENIGKALIGHSVSKETLAKILETKKKTGNFGGREKGFKNSEESKLKLSETKKLKYRNKNKQGSFLAWYNDGYKEYQLYNDNKKIKKLNKGRLKRNG